MSAGSFSSGLEKCQPCVRVCFLELKGQQGLGEMVDSEK